jgi:hypothetical protein
MLNGLETPEPATRDHFLALACSVCTPCRRWSTAYQAPGWRLREETR